MNVEVFVGEEGIKVNTSTHTTDNDGKDEWWFSTLQLTHGDSSIQLFFDDKHAIAEFAAHVTQAVQRLGEDE